MPYATTSDLPATVRDVLPDVAQALFLRVHTSAVNSGESDEDAMRLAWTGIANAGYAMGADGKYAVTKRLVIKKRRGGLDLRVPITSVDGTDDVCKVFGWASVSLDTDGRVVVDDSEEVVPAEDLEALAYGFVAKSREFNVADHFTPTVGHMIESIMFTPAKRIAMGGDGSGPTGWWVGCEVRGDVAKRARAGEFRMFSIETTAYPEANADGTTSLRRFSHDGRITLVDAGANPLAHIAVIKNASPAVAPIAKEQVMNPTLEQLIAPLSPEAKAAIMKMFAEMSAAPKGDVVELEKQLEVAKRAAKMTDEEKAAAEFAALPVSVQKRLKDQDEREKVIAKERADDRAKISAMEEANEFAVVVAKRKTELKHAAGDLDAFIAATHRVAKGRSTPADADTIAAFAAQQSAAIATNPAFSSIGRNTNANPAANSADAVIVAKSIAKIEASADLKSKPKDVAMALARVQVYRENPDLVVRMKAEQAGNGA